MGTISDGTTTGDSISGSGAAVLDPRVLPALRHSVARDLRPRYALRGYLGRGAFATVWSADDTVTRETVAVKRFDDRLRHSGSFYRELRVLFRLRHERIVRIINFLEAPDTARYLVLEHCGGGSLRRALSRAARAEVSCPLERVRVLAVQLAEGLGAAHRLGVIHRDLKPENVLFETADAGAFGGQARLKLVDFGLASALQKAVLAPDEPQALQALSGSPAYMAPEQFDGRYGPASDVYALGVILCELLLGRRPFEGTPEELAYQHLRKAPDLDGGLPHFWRALLQQMLRKEPAERPSCAELIEQLGTRRTDRRDHACRGGERFIRLRGPANSMVGLPGNNLLVLTSDRLLRYRLDTGALLTTLDLPTVQHVSLSADGGVWLVHRHGASVLSSDGLLEKVLSVPSPIDAAVGYSARDGGRRLAVASGGRLTEWSVGTDRHELWTVPLPARGLRSQLARL
ncbi:MAG: serine/threonine protein kinase, partial [Gemmataceae bacterium]|nr:serine/threonine protein kinase [Gemmataceae bacterium]